MNCQWVEKLWQSYHVPFRYLHNATQATHQPYGLDNSSVWAFYHLPDVGNAQCGLVGLRKWGGRGEQRGEMQKMGVVGSHSNDQKNNKQDVEIQKNNSLYYFDPNKAPSLTHNQYPPHAHPHPQSIPNQSHILPTTHPNQLQQPPTKHTTHLQHPKHNTTHDDPFIILKFNKSKNTHRKLNNNTKKKSETKNKLKKQIYNSLKIERSNKKKTTNKLTQKQQFKWLQKLLMPNKPKHQQPFVETHAHIPRLATIHDQLTPHFIQTIQAKKQSLANRQFVQTFFHLEDSSQQLCVPHNI